MLSKFPHVSLHTLAYICVKADVSPTRVGVVWGSCGNMKYEKQQEQDSQTTSSSLGEKEGAMGELQLLLQSSASATND